tara:strand:+ start:1749 stop:2270 length:522 start_codon:yes stop_codon:yes gene_type:complete
MAKPMLDAVKVSAKFDESQATRIVRALEKMPFNVARREVGQIMKRAFRPAFNTMRSLAPKKSGRLKKSIATITFYSRASKSWVVRLGPRFRGPNRSYTAHFAELGVRPSKRTTRGEFTFFGKGGKLVRTKEVTSGVPKQPFVRPTLNRYRDTIPFRIKKGVREFLVREFKKQT